MNTQVAVVTDAVGALGFLVKYKKKSLSVYLILSLSRFSCFNLHTILPYVTFFCLGFVCWNEYNIIKSFHISDTLG